VGSGFTRPVTKPMVGGEAERVAPTWCDMPNGSFIESRVSFGASWGDVEFVERCGG
jgi:hypothetical protein